METQKRSRRRRRRISRWAALMPPLLLALVLAAGGWGIWHFLTGRTPSAENVAVPDYVREELLTVNEWSRPGDPLKEIRGVVIHYVGNPNTTAQANRNYFESLSSGQEGTYASAHFIVGLEGEVVQCIPLTEIAYASNTRNEDTIAIEVCHPDDTGEFSPETLKSLERLTAWLCETFRLDPRKDVIRHYDVTGKICPKYYVEHEDAWADLLVGVEEQIQADEALRSEK